jgi:hypothetical protein
MLERLLRAFQRRTRTMWSGQVAVAMVALMLLDGVIINGTAWGKMLEVTWSASVQKSVHLAQNLKQKTKQLRATCQSTDGTSRCKCGDNDCLSTKTTCKCLSSPLPAPKSPSTGQKRKQ